MKRIYYHCSHCNLYIPKKYVKASTYWAKCPVCFDYDACKELLAEEEMLQNLLKGIYSFVNNSEITILPKSMEEVRRRIKDLIPPYIGKCENQFYEAIKRNANEENSLYSICIAEEMIKVVEKYEKIFNVSIIKDNRSIIKENISEQIRNNNYPVVIGCDADLLSKYVPNSALYESYEKHIKNLTDWNMILKQRYVDNRINLLIELLNLSPVELNAEIK